MAADTSQGYISPYYTASESSVDEPTTQDLKRWKESWDNKMLLVRLKEEKRDWVYIMKVFDQKQIRKGQTGWTSMWQRAVYDVSYFVCLI
jgi:hypothetical protein